MTTTRRRQRQQAEIANAAFDRPAHALDLAFEHFEEFGPDPVVIETLSDSLAIQTEPALFAEFDALIERFTAKSR